MDWLTWESQDNLDLVLIVTQLIMDSHLCHTRIPVLVWLIPRIVVLGFDSYLEFEPHFKASE